MSSNESWKVNLKLLEQALEDSDMEQVKEHLTVLQKEINTTPYIVEQLLPTDLGLLVKAETTRMNQDILESLTPAKRTRAKPKSSVNMRAINAIDVSKLTAEDLEDF